MTVPKERSLARVWKVVTYGDKSRIETLEELSACGCVVTDEAEFAMFVIGQSNPLEPVEVALARATVAELGFKKGDARLPKVFRRIREIGGSLCSPHVAPQLRIAYRDQPHDEYMYVAMESIVGAGSASHVFSLCSAELVRKRHHMLLSKGVKMGLDVDGQSPESPLPLDCVVVYALRK